MSARAQPDEPRWSPEYLQVDRSNPETTNLRLANYWWSWCFIQPHTEVVHDFGCGVGWGCRILAEQHPNTRILGVDCDSAAISIARESYTADGRAQYQHIDLNEPWRPLVPEPIELAVCFETFEYLINRDLFLEDLVANMQPDGVFLVNVAGDAITQAVRTAGQQRKMRLSLLDTKRLLSRYFRMIFSYDHPHFAHKEYFAAEKCLAETDAGQHNLICTLPIKTPISE